MLGRLRGSMQTGLEGEMQPAELPRIMSRSRQTMISLIVCVAIRVEDIVLAEVDAFSEIIGGSVLCKSWLHCLKLIGYLVVLSKYCACTRDT